MNFRILAASVGPRGRVFALLAATALAVPFARLPASRPRRPRRRAEGQGRAEGRPESRACARRPGARRSRRRPPQAPQRPGGQPQDSRSSADLCALDQILPEGPGRQRQAGLLHRQGRPHRIRPAGGRRRDHRAGRRAEEDPARHAAARHAARSRNPRHRRQQPADADRPM